jgi:hexulose-6-phosphate isomerase
MLKGITYWAFAPEADGAPRDPVTAMREAKNLGYDAFELTVDPNGPISLATTKSEAENIRRAAEEIGIGLKTLACGLAWGPSLTHPDPAIRAKAVEDYKAILRIAAWLGVETILYIPGMVSAPFIPDFEPQPYDVVHARAKEALASLLPFAENLNVKIGVENVWNRYLLSPLEMRDFIDYFGSPFVGSYFDVGNVMLFGHPEHWVKILGRRIFAVHLKDFKVEIGNLSGFVDILTGDVNYPAVMRAFKEIGYTGTFTAEVFASKPDAPQTAIKALNKIEQLI